MALEMKYSSSTVVGLGGAVGSSLTATGLLFGMVGGLLSGLFRFVTKRVMDVVACFQHHSWLHLITMLLRDNIG
jgi:ABC-type dipeptide/oligopeptide/nickel transport system permease subunit